MPQFNVVTIDGPSTLPTARVAWWVLSREDVEAILSFTAPTEGCEFIGFDPKSGGVFATDGHRAMHAGPQWRPATDPASCFAVPRDTIVDAKFGVSLMIEISDDEVRIRAWGEDVRLARQAPPATVHTAFDRFADRLRFFDAPLATLAMGNLTRLERNAFPLGFVEVGSTDLYPGLTSHRHGGAIWSVVTPPRASQSDWSANRRPTFLAVRHADGTVTQGRPVAVSASVVTPPGEAPAASPFDGEVEVETA